jgi:hypothetical protein
LTHALVFVKDASPDEQQVSAAEFLRWTPARGDLLALGATGGVADADDADVEEAADAAVSDSEADVAASAAEALRCSVIGCDEVPDKIRSFTIFRGRDRTPQRLSQLCNLHYNRLRNAPAKTAAAARLARLWTDAELRADARRRRDVVRGHLATGAVAAASMCEPTAAGRETLRLRDGGYQALYERFAGEVAWTRVSLTLRRRAAARLSHWPERAIVCGDDHVPPRTCKNRTVFRERLLRKVHDVHRILGNLVLIHCRVCRERFPTFHPAHAPPVDLAILAACPVGVAEWDGGAPPDERRADATLHHGICRRCSDELRAVEDDPEMRGVARFSAANHMDPLMGYPDDVAARRELDHYIDAASVVESMLVALHHMQVSVC